MQKLRVLSSETNELTHVTPSSALRSMTARQISAPPLSIGICSPSEKTRCTTYRGISALLSDRTLDMPPTYARRVPRTSEGLPRLALARAYLRSTRNTSAAAPDARAASLAELESRLSPDERKLLGAGQAFDACLLAARTGSAVHRNRQLELDRQPTRRVARRRSGTVGRKPPLEVHGPACVKRPVTAAQQIHPGLWHRA